VFKTEQVTDKDVVRGFGLSEIIRRR
jgi:hypothetical protein